MRPRDGIRAFWEHRLEADWTETGVGYGALGRPFNVWMYRVRREVFLREVGAFGLGGTSSRVLDVGSGTGFYVRCWQQVGVGSVTGCDLTDAAVERLRLRHPDMRFVRLDISEPGDTLNPRSFDAVSCMDVLFHITDDTRYEAALHSVAQALRHGGLFVLSENFLHRREQRGEHQVNRTLGWITTALDAAGFEILRRVPMLVAMNAQVDASPLWRRLWGGTLRVATVTRPTGWLAGAALYPLERGLVRLLRESPTTEIMICRRRPDDAARA